MYQRKYFTPFLLHVTHQSHTERPPQRHLLSDESTAQFIYTKKESEAILSIFSLLAKKYPQYFKKADSFPLFLYFPSPRLVYDFFHYYSYEKYDIIAERIIAASFSHSVTIPYHMLHSCPCLCLCLHLFARFVFIVRVCYRITILLFIASLLHHITSLPRPVCFCTASAASSAATAAIRTHSSERTRRSQSSWRRTTVCVDDGGHNTPCCWYEWLRYCCLYVRL